MNYKIHTSNAGHSEGSPGASGNGYKEHIIAREINKRLITLFKNAGLVIHDTTSDAKTNNAVLQEQVRKANSHSRNGRLDISIHLNAVRDPSANGVEVLYYSEKALAAKVSKAIAEAGGFRNRGAKERKELYFLRNTNAPAILIEVCFISNKSDMDKLMKNMDKIVQAIFTSITGKQPTPQKKPTPTPKPQKSSGIYRVIVNGKQIMALSDKKNIINQLDKHIGTAKEITLKRI